MECVYQTQWIGAERGLSSLSSANRIDKIVIAFDWKNGTHTLTEFHTQFSQRKQKIVKHHGRCIYFFFRYAMNSIYNTVISHKSQYHANGDAVWLLETCSSSGRKGEQSNICTAGKNRCQCQIIGNCFWRRIGFKQADCNRFNQCHHLWI